MKKKLGAFFILLFFIPLSLCTLVSCADRTLRLPSPSELLIDIHVSDRIAFPTVTVTCTNVSKRTVSLAKAYTTSNVMEDCFFTIWEQFSISDTLLQAEFCPSEPQKSVSGHIQLAPSKHVTFSFSLCDFFRFPPDLCTSLYIAYNGPLGSSVTRTLYLHSDPYTHYGETELSIKKDKDTFFAILDFTNTSNTDIFLPTSVFPNADFLTEDFFAIAYELPSGEWFSAPYYGSNEGLPTFFAYKDCRIIQKGEHITREIPLQEWYDIPVEATALSLEYYGYTSPVSHTLFP